MLQRIFLFLLASTVGFAQNTTYHLVIGAFDWGPSVQKVIVPLDNAIEQVNKEDFSVMVSRSSDLGKIPNTMAQGERQVIQAYISDANGNAQKESDHVTLLLAVAPFDYMGSPIQYFGRMGNKWIDYKLRIKQFSTNKIWDSEGKRSIPDLDVFDLTGSFTSGKHTLAYASFTPKNTIGKAPLIIWLHGGGEGGTDPSIAAIGNKAVNYANPEIQAIFGSAYVLMPQAPTFWMDKGDGTYTRGEVEDTYNLALLALIKDYVKKNPRIDENRIYIGGCSNGGYMSLKLILKDPLYFAAAYISALAYHAKNLSDKQVESIKNIPIWFVHSKDDPVTIPSETVVPTYERLMKAGAKNVHFSYYDHVVDITNQYGGEQYHYNGHWSWIYSHANHAMLDFDGKPVKINGVPVTIMQWLSQQKK